MTWKMLLRLLSMPHFCHVNSGIAISIGRYSISPNSRNANLKVVLSAVCRLSTANSLNVSLLDVPSPKVTWETPASPKTPIGMDVPSRVAQAWQAYGNGAFESPHEGQAATRNFRL
jgi:hypothetical protein